MRWRQASALSRDWPDPDGPFVLLPLSVKWVRPRAERQLLRLCSTAANARVVGGPGSAKPGDPSQSGVMTLANLRTSALWPTQMARSLAEIWPYNAPQHQSRVKSTAATVRTRKNQMYCPGHFQYNSRSSLDQSQIGTHWDGCCYLFDCPTKRSGSRYCSQQIAHNL